jgi:hypothetical protein
MITGGQAKLSEARSELRDFARALESFPWPVRIAEVSRSDERQRALYASGRTAPGPIVTEATVSAHGTTPASAIDFDILDPGSGAPFPASHASWTQLGERAKAAGLTWGGNWSFADKRHVEAPGWKRLATPKAVGISAAVLVAAAIAAALLFKVLK